MEYNKQQYRKMADKKILHKIKKHWVAVSVALLGIIGGATTTERVNASQITPASSDIHAQVNTNNSPSHSSLVSMQANHSTRFDQPIHNPGNFHREHYSVNSSSNPQENLKSDVIAGANALHNHIILNSGSQGSSFANSGHNQNSNQFSQSSSSQIDPIHQVNNSNLATKIPAGKGLITVQYIDGKQIVQSEKEIKPLEHFFSSSYYQNHLPVGYKYVSLISGSNVWEYTSNPQVVKIGVEKTKAEIVRATIQYIDISSSAHDIVRSKPISGQLGDPMDYSRYISQVPLGYAYSGLASSNFPYLEDGNVYNIDVKETNGGPTNNKPASSNSNHNGEGTNQYQKSISIDSLLVTSYANVAYSNLDNQSVATDQALISQVNSDRQLLQNTGKAVHSDLNNPDSSADQNASQAVESASTVVNETNLLISTADSSYAASTANANNFQSLSNSVTNNVNAIKSNVSAYNYRVVNINAGVNSLSNAMHTLFAKYSTNEQIELAQTSFASAFSNASQDQRQFSANGTSISQDVNQTSHDLAQHSFAEASSMVSEINNLGKSDNQLVGQLNSLDGNMTSIGVAANRAARDHNHVVPNSNTDDRVTFDYLDADRNNEFIGSQTLNDINVRHFDGNLINHLLNHNIKDLMQDNQQIHWLLGHVPTGYGVIQIQDVDLKGNQANLTLQVSQKSASSLSGIINRMKPTVVQFDDLKTGRIVHNSKFNNNDLKALILGKGDLNYYLNSAHGYRFRQVLGAKISNDQPILILGVQKAPQINTSAQATIQIAASEIANDDNQLNAAINDSNVKDNQSFSSRVNNDRGVISNASASVNYDLINPNSMTASEASNEMDSAGSALSNADSIMQTANTSASVASASLGAAYKIAGAASLAQSAALIANEASNNTYLATSDTNYLDSLSARFMGGNNYIEMHDLLERINGYADNIQSYGDSILTTDHYAQTLLSSAKSTATIGNYNQAVLDASTISGISQPLVAEFSGDSSALNALQQTSAQAVQLIDSLPASNTPLAPKKSSSSTSKPLNANNGIVNMIYVDKNNNVISDQTIMGKIGTTFNLNAHDSVPNGYQFEGILSGTNVSHFTQQPQTITILLAGDNANQSEYHPSSYSPASGSSSSASNSINSRSNGSNNNLIASNSSLESSTNSKKSVASSGSSSYSNVSNKSDRSYNQNSSSSSSPTNNGTTEPEDSSKGQTSNNGSVNSANNAQYRESNNHRITTSNSNGLPQTGESTTAIKLASAILSLLAGMCSLGLAINKRYTN